jgi:hypothetical protein
VAGSEAFASEVANRWNDPGFALAAVIDAVAIGRSRRAIGSIPPVAVAGSGLPEPEVVVGIIDEGIAIAHERFRRRDGSSRVASLWIQDGCRPAGAATVPYGSELDRAAIDGLIRKHSAGGRLHEAAFYAEAGLADYAQPRHASAGMRASHGTHVMDLAAGFDPGEDRGNRPILCVQLPESAVADTSGNNLAPFLFDAICFIFDRAARLSTNGKPPPVVINFSSGSQAGPLDGSSLLETAIDDLVASRRGSPDGTVPTEIVMPAGNSLQSRSHAEFRIPAGGKQRIALRLQPDDLSFSFIEVWARGGKATPQAILRVTEPFATAAGTIRAGAGRACMEWTEPGGSVACRVYAEDQAGNRARFVIALAPTAAHRQGPGLAPAGCWTLELENDGQSALEADATIHWDGAPLGYRRHGRQSYFEDPAYRVFDPETGAMATEDDPRSIVRRGSTLNALSSGSTTIVASGYSRDTRLPAKYASRGPDRKGTPGIDVSMPVDDGRLTPGILAAGSFSGSRVRMNGTSVAAPQVTRLVADAFATGATDGKAVVKAAAIAAEGGQPPPKPSSESVGWGRIG